jgi:hypothetical protein
MIEHPTQTRVAGIALAMDWHFLANGAEPRSPETGARTSQLDLSGPCSEAIFAGPTEYVGFWPL